MNNAMWNGGVNPDIDKPLSNEDFDASRFKPHGSVIVWPHGIDGGQEFRRFSAQCCCGARMECNCGGLMANRRNRLHPFLGATFCASHRSTYIFMASAAKV